MQHNFLENYSHLNVNVNTQFKSNTATALIPTVYPDSHYSEPAVLAHRFKTKGILELEGFSDHL